MTWVYNIRTSGLSPMAHESLICSQSFRATDYGRSKQKWFPEMGRILLSLILFCSVLNTVTLEDSALSSASCVRREIEAMLPIVEKQTSQEGGKVIDHIYLKKIALETTIERENYARIFQMNEIEQILAKSSALKCIQVIDTCMREFNVSEVPGIGLCLQVSSIFVDVSALNGFASFIPKGRYFDRISFQGWSASWDILQTMLLAIVENVLQLETGVVTLEGIDRIEEVAAFLNVPGLCALSVNKSSLSLILSNHCRYHETQVVKAYVINLRSVGEARLGQFLRQFEDPAISKFFTLERFDALDGRLHAALTPSLKRLFSTTRENFAEQVYEDHNFRKGVLGCALSHMIIWEEMVMDDSMDDLDAYLIFEDDAMLTDDFSNVWRYRWVESEVRQDSRWDVLYLGFLQDNKFYPTSQVWPYVESFSRMGRLYGGGQHGYLLRKKGARLLLESARKKGIHYPIDWFLILSFTLRKELLAFKYSPPLVTLLNSTTPSSTFQVYGWGNENLCNIISKHQVVKGKCDLSEAKIQIVYPKNGTLIPPDSKVQFGININEIVSDFALKNPCFQICFALQEIKSRTEPKNMQCHFVFDDRNEYFLDWEEVLFEAKLNRGNISIHAAAVDLNGNVIDSTRAEKVSVGVNLEWVRIHQSSDGTADIYVTVYSEPSEGSFLRKHGSDMICIEGFKPCVHLASLPRLLSPMDLNVGSATRRVLLRNLGGTSLFEGDIFLHNASSMLQIHLYVI